MFHCQYCKAPFVPSKGLLKFCSDVCKKKHHSAACSVTNEIRRKKIPLTRRHLNEDLVREIRRRYAVESTVTHEKLAHDYQVSISTISHVLEGYSWAWVK